nr:MAG TPA: hypothetical protein [Caudoviricetes sp.]
MGNVGGFLLPLQPCTVAFSQKSAPVQPLAFGSGAFLLSFIMKRYNFLA